VESEGSVVDEALVVTWTRPVVGRETLALDYGLEVKEYWATLAAEGKCSPPELFFFSNGHGLWMVKGDIDTLWSIHVEAATQRLVTKGQLLLEDFAFDFVTTGKDAEAYMLTVAGVGQEIGIL
jgi:hypothetical protein